MQWHLIFGVSLTICLALVSGCSKARTVSKESLMLEKQDPRLYDINKDPQRGPEEEFLLNEGIVSRASAGCKANPAKAEHTPYGTWVRYSDCNISINDDFAPLREISILINRDSKRAEGYSALISGEQHKVDLRAKYGEGVVSRSTDTCSRIGENAFPVLKIVTFKYCDQLEYKLL